MRRWNYRRSKPAALFSALVGIGMLVFVLTSFPDMGSFKIFWCLIVVGIVGMNLWSAFGGPPMYYAESDDDGPPPPMRRRGRGGSHRDW